VPQEGVLRVYVNPVTQELAQLVTGVYDDIALGVSVANGVMPITEDQLLRYVVTALRVRVAHVLRERSDIRVQDPWALPHVFNYIISAIGVVELEYLRIIPVWNHDADGLLMTLDEQIKVTQQLRALKFRGYDYARALSSEREGHLMVMTLVHMVDEWVGNQVFTIADAIVAAVVGIDPEVRPVFTEAHPLYVPAYKVQDVEVVRYLPRLIDVKVKSGVPQP
jgi:hypothetical protein